MGTLQRLLGRRAGLLVVVCAYRCCSGFGWQCGFWRLRGTVSASSLLAVFEVLATVKESKAGRVNPVTGLCPTGASNPPIFMYGDPGPTSELLICRSGHEAYTLYGVFYFSAFGPRSLYLIFLINIDCVFSVKKKD